MCFYNKKNKDNDVTLIDGSTVYERNEKLKKIITDKEKMKVSSLIIIIVYYHFFKK